MFFSTAFPLDFHENPQDARQKTLPRSLDLGICNAWTMLLKAGIPTARVRTHRQKEHFRQAQDEEVLAEEGYGEF